MNTIILQHMRVIPFFFILLLYFGTNLSAQEKSSQQQDSTETITEPRYFFEEISVTARRSTRQIYAIPNAINVLEKDEIQYAEAGLSLEESLRATPGVTVSNRHNFALGDRISIRGIGSRSSFGVRGIKVILDDIPLTMVDGQSQLNNLELSSAGKIEIMRGPSSSLYGTAGGGLINIQTEFPASQQFFFQPKVIMGEYGLQKWQGKVSGTIGCNAYQFNVSKLTRDGFREHSSARSTSVNAITQHNLSTNLKINAVFSLVDSPYLLNPGSLSKKDAQATPEMSRFFVQAQGAGKQIRQAQAGVTLTYKRDDTNQIKTTIFGLSRSLLNPIPGRIIELDRKAEGVRAVYERRLWSESRPVRLTVGTDLGIQNDERREFENLGIPADQIANLNDESIFEKLEYGDKILDQDENVLGLGIFSDIEFAFSPKWAFIVGVRYDRFRFKVDDQFFEDGLNDSDSRIMDKLSPMLGLIYRPQPFFSVYCNFATGFQTPTTAELSNSPEGAGGFNPSLQPEKLKSYEIGLKGAWPKKNIHLETALYLLDIQDMLIPFQLPDPSSEEIFFRNAGKTRNQGVELDFRWIPSNSFRVSGAYTFMNFEFRDYVVEIQQGEQIVSNQLAGNEIPGVSPHHFFLELTYRNPTGIYAELNLQWWDKTFANDFNSPHPGLTKSKDEFMNDSYSLVDLRLGLELRVMRLNLNFFVGVNNALDEQYNGSIVPNAFGNRFFEPAPGRNLYYVLSIGLPTAI